MPYQQTLSRGGKITHEDFARPVRPKMNFDLQTVSSGKNG
jgi:hypothetical protein